jgi:hypothetical protein
MNKLHWIAAVCFSIAIILYQLSSSISVGLGVIGILFECAAWVSWYSADDEKKNKR